MSRFLPERLFAVLRKSISAQPPCVVGLDARGAAWQTLGPTRQLQWQHLAWSSAPHTFDTQALTALVQTLALPSGTGIHWMLAPSLIRHWLQSPPSQTASLSELHAVALARAAQLFGQGAMASATSAAQWTVAAHWHATQPFLCAGIHPGLHQALQQATGGAPCVYSPLTLTLSQFQHQLPQHGWLSMALDNELHVMQFERGRVRRLRSVRVALEVTPSELEHLAVSEWQREMLRAHSDATSLLWLSLTPSPLTNVSSPMLKPIHRHQPAQMPAAMPAVMNTALLSEAQYAAWCGRSLLEERLA